MATSTLPTIIKHHRFWAIQLSNSQHRIWENTEENISKLIFQWQEVNALGYESLRDISIEVGQSYPDLSRTEVKNIANGIHKYAKIKDGDIILGVKGDTEVQKVGIVELTDSEKVTRIFSFNVKWVSEIKSTSSERPIFNPTEEIQTVTPRMFSQLNNLPIEFIEKYDFSERVVNYMHEPEYKFITEPEPKEDKGGKITLFFGTNRRRSDSDQPNEYYNSDSGELEFGTCEVSIPKGHIQGEIERPFKAIFIEFGERENSHFILSQITPTDQTTFSNSLSKRIALSPNKSAFIFIHGYNTSFAEAAWRTAQIAWDIPFDGPAGFFSWPSSAKAISYAADIEKADASIPALEKFISQICSSTGIEKLHLIAHSMGNRILTVTLNNLSNHQSFKSYLPIINQIVLGAPDIDKEVFMQNILPIFKHIGVARTLYASDKDKALKGSAILRGGRTRIGDTRNSVFIAESIDTIDASNVPSDGNNHSYIFETKELLSDLFYLLTQGFSPIQRRLRPIENNGHRYWLFPK